jgi:hypothetical protein
LLHKIFQIDRGFLGERKQGSPKENKTCYMDIICNLFSKSTIESLKLFSLLPKKHQLQNILTFFTFYITLIIFYYYLNKKNPIQYKFFLLFRTNFFYFISHQLLFINTKKKKKMFSYLWGGDPKLGHKKNAKESFLKENFSGSPWWLRLGFSH